MPDTGKKKTKKPLNDVDATFNQSAEPISDAEAAALDAEMEQLDSVSVKDAFNDFTKRVNATTLNAFSGMWRHNVNTNWPRARALRGVIGLQKVFFGTPAVILGAGPSLEENCRMLEPVQHRFAVIATGHAYERALAAGIQPDLVVFIDGQESVNEQIACHRPGDLVAMPAFIDPGVFNRVGDADAVMFDAAGGEFSTWISNALWGGRNCWHGPVSQGGSVTAAAAAMAVDIFSAPILIFMGLDLCVYDKPESGSAPAEVSTVRGHTAWTSPQYWFQKEWFENEFMQKCRSWGVEIVNATGNGILEGDCIHTTAAGIVKYQLAEDRDYAAKMRATLDAYYNGAAHDPAVHMVVAPAPDKGAAVISGPALQENVDTETAGDA